MKIFDAHVHIFPVKIAAKASKNIGAFYDLKMNYDGSVQMLKESCEKNGVSKCLVHSVATTHEQVAKINDFIHESVMENPEMFVGFCSLHPDMSAGEIDAEIKRAISLGLKGIKLHPDFQTFNIDDKHAMEMYEVIDNRLPILIHTGDRRYSYSDPERLAAAAKRFSKQRFIGAHFGGWSVWDRAAACLPELENVYVDTCSSLSLISSETAMKYINAYGVDRVFFGTDYPMWTLEDELRLFDKLPLTDEQREKILWSNIMNFLGEKD